MQQLSGLDASFLYFETESAPMHVGSVAIYDPSTSPYAQANGGVMRFTDILKYIETRLHLARCFRQRLAEVPLNLDHPYWIEDPNFDLEFHVRHIALPKPGDWRQLCIQSARLHARPLDRGHPLWEISVIEGLDHVEGIPEGCYALVSKTHHAAIDGVSGMEIVAAMHDLTPDAEPPQEKMPWVAETQPNALELLTRTHLNNIRQPFRFMRVLRDATPSFLRASEQVIRGELKNPMAGVRIPRTRFNATISPHRVVDARIFSLDEVRAIRKNVKGATVNDVVLTICGGALRKYLQAHNELPAESLVTMAPVNVRAKEEANAAGNQISQMLLLLYSDIEDPLERLKAVYDNTSKTKELTNAIGARMMTDFTQFTPSALTGLAARLSSRLQLANRVNPVFNCVITNVPGPQVPLYSSGSKLVTSFSLGPIGDGMALIHPITSYCGQLTIGFTSCREIMPDPEFYAECVQASFDELKAAAISPNTQTKAGHTDKTNNQKPRVAA